jgi:hypothetical protein
MVRRDWNQVKRDARRAVTTGGLRGNLITKDRQIRERPLLEMGRGRIKCQEFQLILLFETYR